MSSNTKVFEDKMKNSVEHLPSAPGGPILPCWIR